MRLDDLDEFMLMFIVTLTDSRISIIIPTPCTHF
jgi:hypothetical protein